MSDETIGNRIGRSIREFREQLERAPGHMVWSAREPTERQQWANEILERIDNVVFKWSGNILHNKGCEAQFGPFKLTLQKYDGPTPSLHQRTTGNHRNAGRVAFILHIWDDDTMKAFDAQPLHCAIFADCSPAEARAEAITVAEWLLAYSALNAEATP